ncbi:MAG: helix-turn-helix transcriptional regulator [Sphingomonadales bacterium]|nr:helix-turn-helix transcriptional regulator [Sphingomonadales bacterium]
MLDLSEFPEDLRPGIARLAAEMARHGTGRESPVREVMALLGDRWTTLILLVLATGEWRHAELRRALARLSAEQAISQRVLTLKLRALERDGFASRHATADVPPRVSYRLTPLGRGLVQEARRQIDWINAHANEIAAARIAFDAAED